MATGRNWFSIIIAPHNRADSWKLKVPGWMLWALVGVFVAGIAGLVSLGFLWRAYRGEARLVEQYRVENERLLEANQRIALLEEELIALGEFQSRVRQWVGLPADSTRFALGQTALAPAPGSNGTTRYAGVLPSAGWQWPARGWISRGFDVEPGKGPGHFGIDIVAGKSEKVRATRAGRVIFCGWDERFGNLIVVDHGDGYRSRYGHNSDLLVAEGDQVLQGQEIAIIGSTGISSAPHLHLEIIRDGEPIDPMTVLPEQ